MTFMMTKHRLTLLITLLCFCSVAQAQRQPPPDIQPMSINVEDLPYPYPVEYLELDLYGHDIRMAYMDAKPMGRVNGKTVMMLHGMNWFGEYFGDAMQRMSAEGFRVIAPNQVGFGRSSTLSAQ